jgi:uncharacterized BrkB/YihY/UPF0761 family membrane protein
MWASVIRGESSDNHNNMTAWESLLEYLAFNISFYCHQSLPPLLLVVMDLPPCVSLRVQSDGHWEIELANIS